MSHYFSEILTPLSSLSQTVTNLRLLPKAHHTFTTEAQGRTVSLFT